MLKVLNVMICFMILLYNYKKNRIVSSSSMWIFCYILIFIVYPIYTPISYNNSHLIDYLSLIGIIIYSIGFIFSNKVKIVSNKSTETENKKNLLNVDFKIPFSLFCIFAFITFVIIQKTIGIGTLKEILNGNLTSKQLSLGQDINTTPLVFSMHLMVPCILSMWVSSINKKQKTLSFFALLIYIIETILFGFTRLFLITIFGIIFFYEIRNVDKKKQLICIIAGVTGLTFFMVFLNFIRNLGLTSSSNFGNYLNLDFIFESTDFSASYKFFDQLLNYDSPYISPIVYLKPIFAFIPRSIWPLKPEPLSMQVLKYLDPWLASTGFSTAGNSVLGEGYAVFGYFGMFMNCFIWGLICGKFDINYRERLDNKEDHSIYNIFYYIFAVFIVISGQRGDWSQYMTVVLWFYFIPIYLFSKINIKSKYEEVQHEK